MENVYPDRIFQHDKGYQAMEDIRKCDQKLTLFNYYT